MKPRDSHIWPKNKDGFYVEPSWCSQRLFEVERFPEPILDPACGFGTIVQEARKAGYRSLGADIEDRRTSRFAFWKRDFLTWTQPIHGSVVTNPPFDHVEDFVRLSLDRGARKVAAICLVRRLNAAHWLRALPLAKVYLLTPRPSMPPGSFLKAGGKASGGTQDFCWLILDPLHKGSPALHWLHRDR
jgi:hypothetical protein